MRWTTISVAALGAAALAWINGPLFDAGNNADSSLAVEFGYSWAAAVIVAPMFIAVVGAVLGVFRALWLSTRRAELAAQIALGRTRRSLVGGHARAGLLDGLIAAGAGMLLGGVARQLSEGVAGASLVSSALLNYVFIVLWLALSFVIAYWGAALWATRGSVREVASGHKAGAGAGSRVPGKRGLCRRWWVWAVGVLVVVGSILVTVGPWQMTPGEGRGALQFAVVSVATVVVALIFYLAVPGLLALGGAKSAIGLSRALARTVARPAAAGSVRSLAADGLARPTPLRTAAATAVVAVMGVAAVWTTMIFSQTDAFDTANDLAPHASVSTVDLWAPDDSQVSLESGWAEQLPHELLADVHADPDLIVVEAGVLLTDNRTVELPGNDGEFVVRDQLLAVDPTALDTVSPGAGKRLYLVDGARWHNGMLGRTSYSDDGNGITVNGERVDVTDSHNGSPWAGVSRTWAESTWGEAPTAAVLLYPAGNTPVSESLDAHSLDGLHVTSGDASFGWDNTASRGAVAAVTAPFLALAVAIVIALAWSGQRLRARDQATMLALGATPAALRKATAIESGVLTAVAGLVGLLGGAVSGPVLSTLTQAPLGQASIDVLLWNMGQDFAATPWSVLSVLVVGAAAIAAAGAVLVRLRMDRLTPAQQLTEAQKSGIS